MPRLEDRRRASVIREYRVSSFLESDIVEPINIGSSELVSINDLVDLAAEIAGIDVTRTHDLSAPQGVRGRNSDNTLILELMGWEPSTPLRDGLAVTYGWIWDQIMAARA